MKRRRTIHLVGRKAPFISSSFPMRIPLRASVHPRALELPASREPKPVNEMLLRGWEDEVRGFLRGIELEDPDPTVEEAPRERSTAQRSEPDERYAFVS